MFNPAFEIFAILLAIPVGWALTYRMGRANYPQDHFDRAVVGPMWIAIAAIIFFFGGLSEFWASLLCGLAIIGSLARSSWEYGLRCQERVMVERMRKEPAITDIPHYASAPVRCRLDGDYNIVPLEEHPVPPIGILPWAGTETKA